MSTYDNLQEARRLLFVSGFLTERQNRSVNARITKKAPDLMPVRPAYVPPAPGQSLAEYMAEEGEGRQWLGAHDGTGEDR